MKKTVAVYLLVLMNACVTVNIYFPAAAVQQAADRIVEETWGGGEKPKSETAPRSQGFGLRKTLASWSGVSEAFAQEADINVSNPAIRALKESIKSRSASIKPFMDKGNIGITHDGLLALHSDEGLDLRDRAQVRRLIEAENRDREALYVEIAKANNFAPDTVPKIKEIFAKSWLEQAQRGWWVQSSPGNWTKK